MQRRSVAELQSHRSANRLGRGFIIVGGAGKSCPVACGDIPRAIFLLQFHEASQKDALVFRETKQTKPSITMNTTISRSILCTCSLAALAFSLAGCSKQDSTSAPTAEDAQKAAAPVADTLKQTADSAKAAGETAVSDATKQAQDAAATTTSKAQEWIDKAKSLVAENKLSEASSVLQQLAGQPLTAEQQKLVDSLKEQIQKALAAKATGEGASAVGNLLKK